MTNPSPTFWNDLTELLAYAVSHALPNPDRRVKLTLEPENMEISTSRGIDLVIDRGTGFGGLAYDLDTNRALTNHLADAVEQSLRSAEGPVVDPAELARTYVKPRTKPYTAHQRISLVRQLNAFGIAGDLADELHQILLAHGS